MNRTVAMSSSGLLPKASSVAIARATRLTKVLVAVDFSVESRNALACGVAFARRFGASVVALHVVEPICCLADYGYGAVARQIPDQRKLKTGRARLLAMGRKIPAGVRLEIVTRSGSAHTEIVRAAKELQVDLIVMGTRGSGAKERPRAGSTAQQVVREAPCPVLVVRRKQREFVETRKARKHYESHLHLQ